MEKNISKYLAFRWMALYMLFCDDDLDRADFALSEKIVELEEGGQFLPGDSLGDRTR